MLKFTLAAIGVYVGFALLLYVFQRRLIYLPAKAYAPAPQDVGVPEMQAIRLHTADELELTAWYSAPTLPHLPTMLYLHGNAGHIGDRAPLIMAYLHKGFGVLLLTYRGFSGNQGSPTEAGLYKDAESAMGFLHDHGTPDARIAIFGESLGAAVAIQIATEYAVGAVILQSPFTSLSDIGQYHYPFLPIKGLLWDKFDSISKISRVDAPVLMLVGMNDHIVPPAFSQKLFATIKSPKLLLTLAHKGHYDLDEAASVMRFLQEIGLDKSE